MWQVVLPKCICTCDQQLPLLLNERLQKVQMNFPSTMLTYFDPDPLGRLLGNSCRVHTDWMTGNPAIKNAHLTIVFSLLYFQNCHAIHRILKFHILNFVLA